MNNYGFLIQGLWDLRDVPATVQVHLTTTIILSPLSMTQIGSSKCQVKQMEGINFLTLVILGDYKGVFLLIKTIFLILHKFQCKIFG